MANQEILQTVQQVYKAFVQGDLPTVMDLTTLDVEFLPPPSAKIPWAHPWRGRKEGEQYLKTLVAALEFQDFGADEFIVGRDFPGRPRLPASRIYRHRRLGRWLLDN